MLHKMVPLFSTFFSAGKIHGGASISRYFGTTTKATQTQLAILIVKAFERQIKIESRFQGTPPPVPIEKWTPKKSDIAKKIPVSPQLSIKNTDATTAGKSETRKTQPKLPEIRPAQSLANTSNEETPHDITEHDNQVQVETCVTSVDVGEGKPSKTPESLPTPPKKQKRTLIKPEKKPQPIPEPIPTENEKPPESEQPTTTSIDATTTDPEIPAKNPTIPSPKPKSKALLPKRKSRAVAEPGNPIMGLQKSETPTRKPEPKTKRAPSIATQPKVRNGKSKLKPVITLAPQSTTITNPWTAANFLDPDTLKRWNEVSSSWPSDKTVVLFTDGSTLEKGRNKKHKYVGAGVGVVLDNVSLEEDLVASVRLPKGVTRTQAEGYGLLLGLLLTPPHLSLHIKTDCQSVVHVLEDLVMNTGFLSRKTRMKRHACAIWQHIDHNANTRTGNFTFEWVRGHQKDGSHDAFRSKQADEAARAGCKRKLLFRHFPLPPAPAQRDAEEISSNTSPASQSLLLTKLTAVFCMVRVPENQYLCCLNLLAEFAVFMVYT
eukprot:comp13044_c0_seq1/m.8313 comp13044_c0_seq1/g.8313  ORF comp13044_c0_seq1/g.8313 comp13044_c0_seq1/m.8313 type:complete len:546 (-) comp13044_c0_seq1:135-1772(-)